MEFALGTYNTFATMGDSPRQFGRGTMTALMIAAPALKAAPLSFTSAGRASTVASSALRVGARAGNYGLGTLTWDDAMAAGQQFLGKEFYYHTKYKLWRSADNLRQFRPPNMKKGEGIMRANFESRATASGGFGSNGHVDIRG